MKVPTWCKDFMKLAGAYLLAICLVLGLVASFPYHTFDQWRFARAAKKYPDQYSRCALERCGEWGRHKTMTMYPLGSYKWYHDELCYDLMSELNYIRRMADQIIKMNEQREKEKQNDVIER